MKIISDELAAQIIDAVNTFDWNNEDCYEAAAELLDTIAAKIERNDTKGFYKLVQWPESQKLMEHPRFSECLFVENIEGHNDVGSSAYMCPIDIYEEIFK